MTTMLDALWTRHDAVFHLSPTDEASALGGAIEESPALKRRAIAARFEELDGNSPTPKSPPKPKDNSLDLYKSVLAAMHRANLGANHAMPAALWVRLFRENAVPISNKAIRRIGRARLAVQASHAVLYMRLRYGDWWGPSLRLPSGQIVRGYLFEDLLLREVPHRKSWPYAETWRPVAIDLATRKSPTENKVVESTPRRTRTLDDYRNTYGTRLVNELNAALAVEERRKGSKLLPTPAADRPYRSDLSLADIAKELRSRHPALRDRSLTTLRQALPIFVACTRGPKRAQRGA